MLIYRQLVLLMTLISCVSSVVAEESIVLAVDDSPPYSYRDSDGNYKGLNVDIGRELLAPTNLPVTIVECPWARCVDLVKSGQADMLIGVARTPDREAYFHFIEPAYFRGQMEIGFFVRNDKPEIKRYEDLSSLLIGNLRGSQHFPQFDQDSALDKIESKDIKTAINMLLLGHIDTLVHVSHTMSPYLEQYDPNGLVSKAEYSHSVNAFGYIVLSKKSRFADKLPALNKHMKDMFTSGSLKEAFSEYGIYQPPETKEPLYSQQ